MVIVSENSYVKDGKSYIRVTKVLDVIAKPEFYRWFAKHGYEYCTKHRDNRAAFGTRLHSEIKTFLTGDVPYLESEEMQIYFDSFKDWYGSHVVMPDHLEFNLLNDNLMSGGTADFIGIIDGKNVVADWKTGQRIYDTHSLQVAAYVYMYEQMFDIKLDGACICLFNNHGWKQKFISRSECKHLLSVFRAARKLYRWKFGK